MTFAEACTFLFPRLAEGRVGKGQGWSLEPTRRLLAQLGNPHQLFPLIHVGGTNGKGSVAAMVASVLETSGAAVGLYTSPHLVDVRERITVNGRPISRTAFATWTTRLQEEIVASDASFFEALTAIAFADFAARQVDIAVIEVGLGGRLDSTNVVNPLVATVTNVSLEHTDYLGDSVTSIAREKAGIAKPGVPLVIGEVEEPARSVLIDVAQQRGAVPMPVPRESTYTGPLGLEGLHQPRNAAIARATLMALPEPLRPSESEVARGLEQTRLPGRFDRRGKWLFDVAHNPAGVRSLVASLCDAGLPRPVHVLFAALGDKDTRSMLTDLSAVVDRIILTVAPSAPEQRRVVPVQPAYPLSAAVAVEPDFDRALTAVQEGAETILITGSFHTVGDAMSRLPGFPRLE